MGFSFLSYRVDRKPFLSCSSPPSISLHPCLHTYCISVFQLFYFLLLHLSNSMLPCNFCTTYCSTAPYSENLAPCFPKSSSFCNHILCTPQRSLFLWVLSTLLYTLLLPLGAAPSLHCAPSPSPTLLVMVLLPISFSLSSLDTPTSCVLSSHIQSISLLLLLSLVSLPLLLHTALLNSLTPQTYSEVLFSSSPLFHFYTFGPHTQTSCNICITSPLSLLALLLIWQGHAFY